MSINSVQFIKRLCTTRKDAYVYNNHHHNNKYPMQDDLERLATYVQTNNGSTNTTRVEIHALLLLPSKHYKIIPRIPYLLHGRIH